MGQGAGSFTCENWIFFVPDEAVYPRHACCHHCPQNENGFGVPTEGFFFSWCTGLGSGAWEVNGQHGTKNFRPTAQPRDMLFFGSSAESTGSSIHKRTDGELLSKPGWTTCKGTFSGGFKRGKCVAHFFPMKTRGYVEIPWDVETLGTFVRLHKEVGEPIFFCSRMCV